MYPGGTVETTVTDPEVSDAAASNLRRTNAEMEKVLKPMQIERERSLLLEEKTGPCRRVGGADATERHRTTPK
ncbi:hypothetical protein NDU88_006759 [Pleurodeles waltl]|uniref:Uncharacterized protein n=1 Tax=Pleurodeles waltl TaxID=8319 RepID=A0AAV7LB58_PLEWA|nr:hypothetical protein NDU88_006759 [Pleurodeles waltl]